MYALNFYSPLVADQLRSGRKSATIRLGDKSGKYKKGMVVRVLCGVRFSVREVDATGTPVANGFTCADPHTRSTLPATCHTQRFALDATVHLDASAGDCVAAPLAL